MTTTSARSTRGLIRSVHYLQEHGTNADGR
jgi:hypothetical protein